MTYESSNYLNFATLKQGKIYNELQKKILDGSLEIKEKNRGKHLKEGLTSSSFSPKSQTSSSNKMQKLSELQIKFNSLLSQYQQAQIELTSEINNYSNKNLGKNVYVNSIINDPTANFIGVYKNSLDSPAMEALGGGSQIYNYAGCMLAAVNSGKTYFGLENIDINTKMAQCNIGSDLTSAEKYGVATNGCQKGTDGKMYGGFQTNVTSLYSTDGSMYRGCYYNSPPTSNIQDIGQNMESSGINMQNYSPVYVLGTIGIGPWGKGTFPDGTAQWIWYSSNAQNGAPVNTGSPITFIYGYNYTGTNYVTATVYTMNDDSGDWYLNSIKIATTNGGWGGEGNKFDITLSPGMNYLQCEAINNSGPAGLIATVMYNGDVLFNTNSEWKYTNIPVSSMIINGSNYSVDSCQQYAKQNNYTLFGVKNGSDNTSQCMVSNSFSTATQYGSSDPTINLDNNLYGVHTSNVIYKINNEGADLAFVGKAGYTTDDLNLSEYPASMISKTDSGTTIVGADASCPKDTTYIDSVAWSNMKNTGKLMSSATKCGLADAISSLQKKVDQLKGQLAELSDQMIIIIVNLENENNKINNHMHNNEKSILKNLEMYKDVSKKFGQYKNLLSNNQNLMVHDSKGVLYYENYQYILWASLAVAIIILTVKVVNEKS